MGILPMAVLHHALEARATFRSLVGRFEDEPSSHPLMCTIRQYLYRVLCNRRRWVVPVRQRRRNRLGSLVAVANFLLQSVHAGPRLGGRGDLSQGNGLFW
jgi:hypothetical protein